MRKFLLASLVFLLGFSIVEADKKTPPIGPIPMTPLSQLLYFAVASENPGSIYQVDLRTGDVSTLYTRPHGQLRSFTFHPGVPEKLYYVNANDTKVFRVLWLRDHWSEEEVVYQHTTYVRDIAFGPEPVTGTPAPGGPPLRLFFSEATGAGGGKIYYIRNNRPVLYFHVPVPWAGNFAFDEEGDLYLSSGNRVPAKIYKVVGGTLHTIYSHNEPITGFVVRGGKIYFSNWRGAIYVLDLASGEVEKIFEDSRFRWLSDVNFRG